MKVNKSTGEICDWEWLMKHPNCNGCPKQRECDLLYERREVQIQKQKEVNKWHPVRKPKGSK